MATSIGDQQLRARSRRAARPTSSSSEGLQNDKLITAFKDPNVIDERPSLDGFERPTASSSAAALLIAICSGRAAH